MVHVSAGPSLMSAVYAATMLTIVKLIGCGLNVTIDFAGLMAQPGGFNLSSAAVAGLTQGAATLGNVVSNGEIAADNLYHYGVQAFNDARDQYQPPSLHVR